MSTTMPRGEYPRPQFQRDDWQCLNGEWEFEIDRADTGLERGLLKQPLQDRIRVPFCPESSLSGIGETDFMNAVWYRRQATIPATWVGKRILLHSQAVDYETTVWVNGREAGRHRGGFTPFTCDLGDMAAAGDTIEITVRARDLKDEPKPAGKQSPIYKNHGCLYTRTTGIWQSVWLEPVPEIHLKRPRITPDVGNRRFLLEVPLAQNSAGARLRAVLLDDQGEVTRTEVPADLDFCARAELDIAEERLHLWGPGEPNLYDLIYL